MSPSIGSPRRPSGARKAAPLPADEDPAILLYTSGTTGKSKGVELSFRAVVANTEAVTRLWRFSPEDRMALALPLFHVHGLGLGVHGALLNAMTMLLFERFDAGRIVEAFERDGATLFQGVPTMYVKLLELLAQRPEAAAALARGRLFTSGSAALAADDFLRFEELTGHRILERYGMSETLFTLSNTYEDRRPGTVGLPIARLRDPDRGRVGPRRRSRRARRDPGPEQRHDDPLLGPPRGDRRLLPRRLVRHRRRRAAGTATATSRSPAASPWTSSSRGGFKISAREIEDVLRRHPLVKDVAVIGAPDRLWGQRIVAAVVLHPSSAPAPSPDSLLEELSTFCSKSLADYKRPREVRVVEDLPKNALGKIQKHLILDQTRGFS